MAIDQPSKSASSRSSRTAELALLARHPRHGCLATQEGVGFARHEKRTGVVVCSPHG